MSISARRFGGGPEPGLAIIGSRLRGRFGVCGCGACRQKPPAGATGPPAGGRGFPSPPLGGRAGRRESAALFPLGGGEG